jgi:fluoride exporter
MTWVAVAVGGALGSLARYAVAFITLRTLPHVVVPFATFFVNVVGCFVIGLLAGRLVQHPTADSPELRAFVFVGILGGFTTFSTFALDTLMLVQTGLRGLAIVNAAGQLILGLLAARVGWAIGIRL